MTDLSLLYGGDDNLLGDNIDNSYSPQKFNKMSNNDMSMDDSKSSKPHNLMLQAHHSQQAPQVQHTQHTPSTQQINYKTDNIPQQHVNNSPLIPVIQNQNQLQQYKQSEQTHNDYLRKRGNEYSFFDRMNLKRTEVIKLSLFSLVIVLGISIDRMLTYYLSKYIGDNILTDFQEFLLRISYPITIFLLLWIFKAI